MLASTHCNSEIDPIATKFRIACFQRHGSRRMFIPTRIFVITLQLIPNLNDGKQPAHRDVVAKGSGGALHGNSILADKA